MKKKFEIVIDDGSPSYYYHDVIEAESEEEALEILEKIRNEYIHLYVWEEGQEEQKINWFTKLKQ